MCYWGSHQDGSISPKKTQAKVVAHLYRIFIPLVCVHYSWYISSLWRPPAFVMGVPLGLLRRRQTLRLQQITAQLFKRSSSM